MKYLRQTVLQLNDPLTAGNPGFAAGRICHWEVLNGVLHGVTDFVDPRERTDCNALA